MRLHHGSSHAEQALCQGARRRVHFRGALDFIGPASQVSRCRPIGLVCIGDEKRTAIFSDETDALPEVLCRRSLFWQEKKGCGTWLA